MRWQPDLPRRMATLACELGPRGESCPASTLRAIRRNATAAIRLTGTSRQDVYGLAMRLMRTDFVA